MMVSMMAPFSRGESFVESDQTELVVILLATYNGEKFLKQQLESISAQTYSNIKILIRDDLSTDNTCTIINDQLLSDPRFSLLNNHNQRLGAVGNFSCLLESAQTLNQKYVMFSDQDDFWLPNKVEITLKSMKAAEHEHGDTTPILVHTAFSFVDENLNKIHDNFKLNCSYNFPLPRLLAQNYVYGCTVMINSSLLSGCMPIPPQAENHDYWIALVAAAIGKIVYYPSPTILYRQHSSNVSGNVYQSSLKNRIRRHFFEQDKSISIIINRMLQGIALKERTSFKCGKKELAVLSEHEKMLKSPMLARLGIAIRIGYYRQNFHQNLNLLFLLAKMRYGEKNIQ